MTYKKLKNQLIQKRLYDIKDVQFFNKIPYEIIEYIINKEIELLTNNKEDIKGLIDYKEFLFFNSKYNICGSIFSTYEINNDLRFYFINVNINTFYLNVINASIDNVRNKINNYLLYDIKEITIRIFNDELNFNEIEYHFKKELLNVSNELLKNYNNGSYYSVRGLNITRKLIDDLEFFKEENKEIRKEFYLNIQVNKYFTINYNEFIKEFRDILYSSKIMNNIFNYINTFKNVFSQDFKIQNHELIYKYEY